MQPAHQYPLKSVLLHSVVSFHTLTHPSFFTLIPLVMTNLCWCSMSFLFVVSPPSLFSTSLTTPPFPPWLVFFFFNFKVLAGMNVHPAEFDGLKQEYDVKGYPTFCYFEWVASSHPSHFRPAPLFQGSEHKSRATSNGKWSSRFLSTGRHDGSRLEACKDDRHGSELASNRWKEGSFSDELWGSSGASFEKK